MSYSRGRDALTNYALLRRTMGKVRLRDGWEVESFGDKGGTGLQGEGGREAELHEELTAAWARFAAEFEAKSGEVPQHEGRVQQLLESTKIVLPPPPFPCPILGDGGLLLVKVVNSLTEVCSRANSEPELAQQAASSLRRSKSPGSRSMGTGTRIPADRLQAEARLLRYAP